MTSTAAPASRRPMAWWPIPLVLLLAALAFAAYAYTRDGQEREAQDLIAQNIPETAFTLFGKNTYAFTARGVNRLCLEQGLEHHHGLVLVQDSSQSVSAIALGTIEAAQYASLRQQTAGSLMDTYARCPSRIYGRMAQPTPAKPIPAKPVATKPAAAAPAPARNAPAKTPAGPRRAY